MFFEGCEAGSHERRGKQFRQRRGDSFDPRPSADEIHVGIDGEPGGRKQQPLSLQIVGPEWSEARILAIAGAYEDATPELRAARAPCA